MGRAPRIDLAGLTYHVWANGVAGTRLYRDAYDKDVGLRFLADEVKLSKWIILAYVFMGTHYHVLLRLQEPTLSSGFQRFNLRYARYVNKRYHLRGHAFDAPFEYKIVEGSFNELEVARYIAYNPTRANLCRLPEEYPWSSYGSLIGLFPDDRVVDVKSALAPLAGSRAAYRRYVEEGDARVRWDLVRARSAKRGAAPPRAATRRR